MLNVALVGYTNAGKSSILRMLSGEHEIFVEDRLFATLDTLTREVDLGEGCRARVSDTVGFIRKLPHHLVASFRATLEEVARGRRAAARGRRQPPRLGRADAGGGAGAGRDRGSGTGRWSRCSTRWTRCATPAAFTARVRELYPDAVLPARCASTGWRRSRPSCAAGSSALRPTVTVRVPVADGARLASLYRIGEVLAQTVVGDQPRGHGAAGRVAGGSAAAGRGGGAWRTGAAAETGRSRSWRSEAGRTERVVQVTRASREVDSVGPCDPSQLPAVPVSLPTRPSPLSTCSRISQRFMPANFWCILVIGGAAGGLVFLDLQVGQGVETLGQRTCGGPSPGPGRPCGS